MIERSLAWIAGQSPALKRRLWQAWYHVLTHTFQTAEITFLNYGYAEEGSSGAELTLRPEDEPNRHCIQLYNRVAGAVDLQGREVLEVGSGRGGGCSYIARYLEPKSVCGVDYSRKAIAFCQRVHSVESLTFQPGDAEALTFERERFDAVINVESSHCYGSMERFLSEAARVLRPGGYLLWADLREREVAVRLRDQFRGAGFSTVEEEEITSNVLRALDLDHERKRDFIATKAPKFAAGPVGAFAGLKGSAIYEAMRSGRTIYLRCVLRKDG